MHKDDLIVGLYSSNGLSVRRISRQLAISEVKVRNCLLENEVQLRSRAETAYLQHNKSFKIKKELYPKKEYYLGWE